MHPQVIPPFSANSAAIVECEEAGLLILSLANHRPTRRVLFINVSGGKTGWAKYKSGLMPSNRLWGAVELVKMGYEVGVADTLPDFYLHRNPLPHDLRLLRACRDWLQTDDIVYCAHNTLYWLPFLRRLGLFKRHVVSLLYAREPLEMARGHSGILALNPAAADHARKLAPRAKIAHVSWGMDLDFLPVLPYKPTSFLACGRTNRDFGTLSLAAAQCQARIRVIGHNAPDTLKWSDNVDLIQGGAGWETRLTYRELLNNFYAECCASLVILKHDPIDYTACGFTNVLEAMAMGRPVILTRTNANRSELDIEALRCGLQVPPNDAGALAAAITSLDQDPELSRTMGQRGRQLCESHYNMVRFGSDLHRFFQDL